MSRLRGGFATAAQLCENLRTQEQAPSPSEASIDWNSVDWSQQEREARVKVLQSRAVGPHCSLHQRATLRAQLNARLHQEKRSRASTLNTLPSQSVAAAAKRAVRQHAEQLAKEVRVREAGSPQPHARTIEHRTSQGPARRARAVVVRATAAEVGMMLAAEQEASQQEAEWRFSAADHAEGHESRGGREGHEGQRDVEDPKELPTAVSAQARAGSCWQLRHGGATAMAAGAAETRVDGAAVAAAAIATDEQLHSGVERTVEAEPDLTTAENQDRKSVV